MPSGPHPRVPPANDDDVSVSNPHKLWRNLDARSLLQPVPEGIVLHGGRVWQEAAVPLPGRLMRPRSKSPPRPSCATAFRGGAPLPLPYTPPVPTFDALANLPLEIEHYELQPLEFQTPGFERLSTVIR